MSFVDPFSHFDPLTQPPPNPDELAVIVTRASLDTVTATTLLGNQFATGQSGVFTDWEQVFVQLRMFDGYGVFRFLAVERDPMPTLWNRLQFIPGDEVGIYLGGQLAIAGNIDVRQTAYDANTHGVMLQGSSYSHWAAKSSVDKTGTGNITGNSDAGNFDGMNFQAVAAQLLSKYGVPFSFQGILNPLPFVKLQAEPGETVFNFLERIARPRGIVIGNDQNGAMVFYGDRAVDTISSLVEGQNILRMQAIWSTENNFNPIGAIGQTAASDSQNGTDASEQTFKVAGIGKRFAPWITVSEQPVWNLAELADRARNEAKWQNTDWLVANVTVQGWKNSTGVLWRPGDQVYVYSPMAMLNDTLAAQSVTYSQDSQNGSTTTLELVLPWRLNIQAPIGGPSPNTTTPNTTDPNAPNAPPPAPAPPPTTPAPMPPTINTAPG